MGNRIVLLFYAVAALSAVFAVSASILLFIRRKTGRCVRVILWLLFFLLTVVPIVLGPHLWQLRLFTNFSGGMRIETRIADGEGEPVAVTAADAHEVKMGTILARLLLTLWFIAAAASASYGISAYFNTLRFLTKHSEHCRDERVNRIFAEARKKAGVRASVSLRVMHNDLKLSPCTCGTWSPSVFIGGDYLDEYPDRWLELVFLHELTHIRHGDALLRLAALLVTSFHALLPQSAGIRQAVNEDVEYLCDRKVLALEGQDVRGEYIRVILDIAERNLREDYTPDNMLSNASEAGEFLVKRYRRMQENTSVVTAKPLIAALTALVLNAALFSVAMIENPDNLRVDFASPVFADAITRHFDLPDASEVTEETLSSVYRLEFYRPRSIPDDPQPPVYYCIVNEESPERTPNGPAYPCEGLDLRDLSLFRDLRTLILDGAIRPQEGTWDPQSARYAVILRD
ncbi:MAG: M56 family metallopeptidase [Clostridiales bacterium]|nr:M56 family metallopeptidase [Clostridiales bacterium]